MENKLAYTVEFSALYATDPDITDAVRRGISRNELSAECLYHRKRSSPSDWRITFHPKDLRSLYRDNSRISEKLRKWFRITNPVNHVRYLHNEELDIPINDIFDYYVSLDSILYSWIPEDCPPGSKQIMYDALREYAHCVAESFIEPLPGTGGNVRLNHFPQVITDLLGSGDIFKNDTSWLRNIRGDLEEFIGFAAQYEESEELSIPDIISFCQKRGLIITHAYDPNAFVHETNSGEDEPLYRTQYPRNVFKDPLKGRRRW